MDYYCREGAIQHLSEGDVGYRGFLWLSAAEWSRIESSPQSGAAWYAGG